MRVMVFFDLPVGTAAQRRDYAQFRKMLIKEGFLMMQESVYTKLALNATAAAAIMAHVRANRPQERLMQYLELHHRLLPSPCMVLVGLHLYFSREELEQLYRMAAYQKWNLLALEPYQSPPLPQERICIIDKDLCQLG